VFFSNKTEHEKGERRVHRRMDLFLPTYCTLYNDTKKSSLYECWINNISVGGLALKIKDRDLRDFDCDRVNVIYRVGTHQRNDRLYVRQMDRVLMDWRFGCQFLDEDHNRRHVIQDFFKL
jgi:hypothetical protein